MLFFLSRSDCWASLSVCFMQRQFGQILDFESAAAAAAAEMNEEQTDKRERKRKATIL